MKNDNYTAKEASRVIGVSRMTLSRLLQEDCFSTTSTKGLGGTRILIPRGEVHAFADYHAINEPVADN